MFRKRALLYFLIMAFPMGIGAGASPWLKLPKLTIYAPADNSAESAPLEVESPVELATNPTKPVHIPDFGAIHPFLVGVFSLLLCAGILLAAEKPHRLIS